MISFAVNQSSGKKIPLRLWQKWITKIQKTIKPKKRLDISIAVVNDAAIKKLNQIYRGKNQVTDVLSFSENESEVKFDPNYLGEIIICYPQAVRQGKIVGHSNNQELELLLIHGFLHLLEYDHEKKGETEVMRRLEEEILRAENR